jgi:hypothetical protein
MSRAQRWRVAAELREAGLGETVGTHSDRDVVS